MWRTSPSSERVDGDADRSRRCSGVSPAHCFASVARCQSRNAVSVVRSSASRGTSSYLTVMDDALYVQAMQAVCLGTVAIPRGWDRRRPPQLRAERRSAPRSPSSISPALSRSPDLVGRPPPRPIRGDVVVVGMVLRIRRGEDLDQVEQLETVAAEKTHHVSGRWMKFHARVVVGPLETVQ